MALKASNRGLQITEILPNGPVHHAAKLRVGDVLKTVDGKLVGEAGTSVKDFLSGPHGTTVALTVLRHSLFGIPEAISVCVVRGSATTERVERHDSGSNDVDKPPVPKYYTLSELDDCNSGVDDLLRHYAGRSCKIM